MAQILNNADYVICLNSAVAADLEQAGVERTKIKIYHLASDPEMFTAHERRTKAPFTVGLSMRYYKRKNAELLLDIVKNMPDVRFMMLGVRWEKFSRFEELCRLNNFEYHEDIEYSKYPSMYHQMDVFLSTSLLEGGPVPLLEAMLSNVVPVVSNTGFANDIIIHGENGYIFDVNEKVDVVCQLIRNAFKVRNDVRQYVVDYSWKAYASKIEALFDT
ncbi:MAG: glycosyltransferase family 4 protein [Fibrobacterota bacterium]